MSELLLHPQYLQAVPVIGAQINHNLLNAAGLIDIGTQSIQDDPNVSVVIRTRNDAQTLSGLFKDLSDQEFSGNVETIVVDACSNDGTAQVARAFGAHVITTQREHFYNGALNTGISEASHGIVYSLVGHTRLATNQALRAATRWMAGADANVDAAYGLSLPGKNASLSERAGALALGAHKIVAKGAEQVCPDGKEMGVLAADCSLIRVSAYQEVAGLDPRFQAGGADGDLAARMHAAGKVIMREPVLSVHHTHGLNPVQSLKQLQFWASLDAPHAYGDTRGYDYCLDANRKVR